MHRTLFPVLLAAAVSACGGSDPLAACKNQVEAACNRTFQCFPAGAQTLYGSLSDCVTNQQAAICTTENATCPSGYHLDSGAASRCADDYRNASCADLANGVAPASCGQECVR
jgi:hypothetical protein